MAILPYYWKRATEELSERDEIMAGLIATYQGESLQSRGDAFITLIRSIIGQQVSVKAADAIWNKMVAGMTPITPQCLANMEADILRSYGLSRQKIAYLQDIGAAFAEERVHPHKWPEMADGDIIAELVKLKGVGRWTAEMFLIFHMLRPDVLPLADLGVRKAIQNLYYFGQEMADKDMLRLAEAWKPWRTVASWYLWRSLDPVPVAY